jgi:hypothetical protein
MEYSIKSGNLSLVDDHQVKHVQWNLNEPIEELYDEYRKSYVAKNDVVLLGISYFDILAGLFLDYKFSIPNFIKRINQSYFLSNKNQYYYHESLKQLNFALRVNHYAALNFSEQTANQLANRELADAASYLTEIKEKNHIILSEFKTFALGFTEYVKNKFSIKHSDFHRIYSLLKDDYFFFRDSQIKSLSKYKLSIGLYSKKHSESRGKTNDFVPGGLCYYGDNVFINYDFMNKNVAFDLWKQRSLTRTFYHEIGHALNYLYDNENVLKKKSDNRYCSNNEEFLKACKLNYVTLKKIKREVTYRSHNSINYYSMPTVKKLSPPRYIEVEVEPEEEVKEDESIIKFLNEIDSLFGDFLEKKQPVPARPVPKRKFSPKFSVNLIEYDYTRALEESWSESLSFILYWFQNGFREYDQYIIKADKSFERMIIKILYHSMIYILDNFEWSKLNIPQHVLIRKKKKIKEFLNYVNEMPLYLKGPKSRKFQTKKYRTLKDIKKCR